MRKNFKRKNYVLFGAIGIAAIALSGVGFATWITGVQQPTQTTEGISIEVDTVSNRTSYIEAAVSAGEKITIGETTATAFEGSNLSVIDTVTPDFSVVFTTFRVITDKACTLNGVDITIAMYDSTGNNSAENVSVENCGIYPINIRNGVTNPTKKTYITLPKTTLKAGDGLDSINSGDDFVEGYNCYKLTGMKLDFGWGSLFESKKPSEYYKNYIIGDTFDQKLAKANEVAETLTYMNTNMNNLKMKITFTLDVSYSSQS